MMRGCDNNIAAATRVQNFFIVSISFFSSEDFKSVINNTFLSNGGRVL